MRKENSTTESEEQNARTKKLDELISDFQRAYCSSIARGKIRPTDSTDSGRGNELDCNGEESYDDLEAWVQERLPGFDW